MVVGEGWALEKFSLVTVIGSETCHIMIAVVMARGMMIHMMI